MVPAKAEWLVHRLLAHFAQLHGPELDQAFLRLTISQHASAIIVEQEALDWS